jgi:hypothetical protein
MRAFVAWLSALFCWSLVSAVRAEPTSPDRFVVVLKPRVLPVEDWPSGTRAVISELVARGYELVVRSSIAKDLDGLRRELEFASGEPATVGSVAIFRTETTGTALVYTTRSGVITVDADTSEGTLSESSVALRVSELFRDHAINTPLDSSEASSRAPAPAPPTTPAPAPSPRREGVPRDTSSSHRDTSHRAETIRDTSPIPDDSWLTEQRDNGALFFAAGIAVSADLGAPLPIVGAGATSPHLGPLALDLVFAASPGSGGITTPAGDARLSLQTLRSHLVFDPWFAREAGASIALGAGAVWTQASATGEGDFTGKGDDTEVALLSARLAAFVRSGRFRFDLALEPGLMLPEVQVRAADQELAALGRPWTEISANFAWAL